MACTCASPAGTIPAISSLNRLRSASAAAVSSRRAASSFSFHVACGLCFCSSTSPIRMNRPNSPAVRKPDWSSSSDCHTARSSASGSSFLSSSSSPRTISASSRYVILPELSSSMCLNSRYHERLSGSGSICAILRLSRSDMFMTSSCVAVRSPLIGLILSLSISARYALLASHLRW